MALPDVSPPTWTGRRGTPQDMGRRMAEPLRGHSAQGLRELTRSFVMMGEVRLFGKEALNLPGAAAMSVGKAGEGLDSAVMVVAGYGSCSREIRSKETYTYSMKFSEICYTLLMHRRQRIGFSFE